MSTSTTNLQAEKMALIDLISNVNSISVIKSLKRSFEHTLTKAREKEYISKEEILEGIRNSLLEIKESREKGVKLMDAKQLLNEL